jgi:uncharacterized protein
VTTPTGILWREVSDHLIDQVPEVGCIEVMFEDLCDLDRLPPTLARLKAAGIPFIVHGATLSLGSAEPVNPSRIDEMARVVDMVNPPLVSEHIAFVRAGGLDAWHLMPLPRLADAIEIYADNLARVRERIDRPFALENIAYLFEWPDGEMDEAAFITELLRHTGAGLLLDVENVRVNAHNYGFSAIEFIDALPLERVAYVHVAGGEFRDGFARDTHSERVSAETYRLLGELAARMDIPYVIMERDDNFPSAAEFSAEMRTIKAAIEGGLRQRQASAHA